MKRISILLMGATLLLSSCNTIDKTARTAETLENLRSATVVDIIPATEARITHTLRPDATLLRGGEANVRQAAEHEALVKYGNADILLEPQYIVHKERRLFRTKILSVTVSGRPAYYTNYRALHDSVWANPVFNGLYCPPVHNDQCCHHGSLCDHPAFDALDCPPYMRHHSHGGGNGSGFLGVKKVASPKNSASSAYRTKGFAMYLSPFVGGGDIDCEHGTYSKTSWAALFTLGYQFNPYFYVGAGLGVNGIGGGINSINGSHSNYHTALRGTYIPLYGNLRINLSKKKNTPFLDWKMGYGLGGNTEAVGGGPVMAFSVGYSFGNFDVAFQHLQHVHGYDYEYYESNRWGGNWFTEYDNIFIPQWGVSFGFRF